MSLTKEMINKCIEQIRNSTPMSTMITIPIKASCGDKVMVKNIRTSDSRFEPGTVSSVTVTFREDGRPDGLGLVSIAYKVRLDRVSHSQMNGQGNRPLFITAYSNDYIKLITNHKSKIK